MASHRLQSLANRPQAVSANALRPGDTSPFASERLVAFTKELAGMLYQQYISNPGQSTDLSIRQFSVNYFSTIENGQGLLCSITDDLKLTRPFVANSNLYIHFKPLRLVPNLPDVISSHQRFNSNFIAPFQKTIIMFSQLFFSKNIQNKI
eukprot:c10841_g1_i1.p1 GENE.c10841_g1_i1~~c10841_g1_i1.p1  ORF type:complete len:150 (-),score=36.57 c10841_g1_i1:26-475(-)